MKSTLASIGIVLVIAFALALPIIKFVKVLPKAQQEVHALQKIK